MLNVSKKLGKLPVRTRTSVRIVGVLRRCAQGMMEADAKYVDCMLMLLILDSSVGLFVPFDRFIQH